MKEKEKEKEKEERPSKGTRANAMGVLTHIGQDITQGGNYDTLT